MPTEQQSAQWALAMCQGLGSMHRCTPGTSAREPAPASRGARMVFRRERSRGPGARATVELPVSSSQHSAKGMVKMPARLVPTVSSSASAALPPTACAGRHGIRRGRRGHVQGSRSSPGRGHLGAESCWAAHHGQPAQHTGHGADARQGSARCQQLR